MPEKKQKLCGKSGLSGHHGRSEVWNYFDKVNDEETKKWLGNCKCKFCGKVIYSPTAIGTNKLWSHRDKCKELPAELRDKSQATISLFTGALSSWKFDQDKSRKALARMIIIDELPFCIVEKAGFKAFCSEVQPKFHLISRQTITKDCYEIFFEEKEKLRTYLSESSTRVCLTSDMWTSIQNLGYLVLTAHFVDKNWILRKKIINFYVVPHPHKGEVIAKVIESCLLEWGLDKIMTITLDNARNNDTCVDDLKKRLNKRNMLLLGGEFFRVRCLAHVINLVVRAGIDEMKETIKRLRRSVKYVRSSPSRLQMFKKCIEEEKITCKRIVCLDVKTRWNSTYLMIDSALPFEKAFDRLEEQDPSYVSECDVIGSKDWANLKSLHAFLEEFYLLTTRISGSHYVSSHTYFDEISNVKVLLTRELSNLDVNRCTMTMKMNEKFDFYCDVDKLNPIFLASLVLDPRNKTEYLELWYDKLLEYDPLLSVAGRKVKVEKFIKSVKLFMSRLYECYRVETTALADGQSTKLVHDLTKKDGKTGSDLKFEIRAKLKRKSTIDVTSDLDRYFNDGIEEESENFDILGWWRGKASNYRAVSIMARDIFSIPITSVASESAFSSAGRVLDPFRSSLTPKLVECLVCAQDWLRSGPLVEVEEQFDQLVEIEKIS
ncbi:hypothetical protein ABFS83_13G078000 [Erythranthe nasuta]